MTQVYDNSFVYDASNLTYEGVASYTSVLSFSLTPAVARTVSVGVVRAATTSVSFSWVRQVALTRLASVTATAQDVLVALAREFDFAVSASVAVTRAAGKTLAASVTGTGSIIVAFPMYIEWVVTTSAAKLAQVTKDAFSVSVATTPTRTLSAGLTSPYSVSLSGSLAKIGAKTLESTATASSSITRAVSLFRAAVATAGAALTRTFGWAHTATLTGDTTLDANGVKVMEATGLVDNLTIIEAQPTNEGAARDIARDGTHDEVVLAVDQLGRQMYLPVRPTSTL